MQSQQVTANAQVAAAAASAQSPQIVGTAGVVNTNAVILKMNDIQTTSTVGEYFIKKTKLLCHPLPLRASIN